MHLASLIFSRLLQMHGICLTHQGPGFSAWIQQGHQSCLWRPAISPSTKCEADLMSHIMNFSIKFEVHSMSIFAKRGNVKKCDGLTKGQRTSSAIPKTRSPPLDKGQNTPISGETCGQRRQMQRSLWTLIITDNIEINPCKWWKS